MRRRTFVNGDEVFVGRANVIPIRYQGRRATVIRQLRQGSRDRVALDFGTRRANPLVVSKRHVKLAA